MARPISLTLRLTLLFSAVATVVFLAFGWVIGQSIEDHFGAEDIKELREIAQAMDQPLATLQSADELARIKHRFDDILVGHHGALLHITDATGQALYSSAGPDFSRMPLSPPAPHVQDQIQQWNDGQDNYRVLIHQMKALPALPDGPYMAIVAVATDFHLHFLQEFRRTLWLMVLGGIIAMGLMGWIAVRHGHRPLHHMVDKIHQISANDLNIRLDPDTVPAELSELAMSFNELLQRMEEAFGRLSNFSADIAHELRTPVTNLMTQTQVALSQARSTAEYREILYSDMEEYERMAQMIGDMLFLAKADDRLMPPNVTEIDLEHEVRKLFDYYEAWAEERQVSLVLEGHAHVQGDSLMLRRALSNLLSNAIRHTAESSTVQVQMDHDDSGVFITVQNPGNAIAAEHLPRLFDRFYRIDPSRQRSGEGAGLGLAIVKSIVEAHDGDISVTSDEASTCFTMRLPIIPIK